MRSPIPVLVLVSVLAGAVMAAFLPTLSFPPPRGKPVEDQPVRIGTLENGLPVYVRLDGHRVEVTFEQRAAACPPPHDKDPNCVYVPAMIELHGFGADGRLKQ